MRLLSAFALATMVVAGSPGEGSAQSMAAELAFKVPINMTQLSPDIAKLRLLCSVSSDAITTATNRIVSAPSQEFTVTGGQYISTATVVFSFTALDNPVGKIGFVTCHLFGSLTSSPTVFNAFSTTATNPAYKISTSSGLTTLTINDQFTWQ